MSTLLRPVRIRCRRHVSPYYVVVFNLTRARPTVHAFSWSSNGENRLTGCGIEVPNDTWSSALADPRHVEHIHACRRCFSPGPPTIRVRREILRLAGFAVGHRPRRPGGSSCAKCWKGWPCPDVLDAARSALDAFADCDWVS